jgi:hypothetical protein
MLTEAAKPFPKIIASKIKINAQNLFSFQGKVKGQLG